jgi:hypothetical protein
VNSRIYAHHLRHHQQPMLGLPPKSDFEIVIARYRENISWARPYEPNVTIYDKSGQATSPSWIPLPNIGREAGTYLHHIVTRYDTLAARTLFLQGNPHEHGMMPFETHVQSTEPFLTHIDCQKQMNRAHIWWVDEQNKSGQARQRRMCILGRHKRCFCQEYVQCPLPNIIRYGWGAQFSATADCIRARPREYYEHLYQAAQSDELLLGERSYQNYQVAVLFEMFWPCIMSPALFGGAH